MASSSKVRRWVWHWTPVGISVALVLATGAVGYWLTSRANDTSEAVHRADRMEHQALMSTLGKQFLLLSAKDAADYAAATPWSLRVNDAKDVARLQGFVSTAALLNYGAALTNLEGEVLSQYAVDPAGLPPATDPGYAPVVAGLMNGEPGISTLMTVGNGHVIAVGVPAVMGGTAKAVLVAFFRAENSALQEYVGSLRYGSTGVCFVADGAGNVIASNDPTRIGSRITPTQSDRSWRESGSGADALVTSEVALNLAGWSTSTQQSASEFYGPIRSGHFRVKFSLVALLALIAAGLATIGLKRKKSLRRFHDELSHQAYHDALTSLPNRVAFSDRLRSALAAEQRGKGRVAVLYLDLDRFKLVNDSMGHEAGDMLLIAAAERLSRTVRDNDYLARMGGDEFTLLMEGVGDVAPAIIAADRLIAEMSRPFDIDGRSVNVGASVGISFSTGTESPQDLLRQADLAMYRAKARGRGRHEIFEPDLAAGAQQRLWAEAELRDAIAADQFVLHYQPELSLADGRIVGVEALVRWNHPVRGLLLPRDFIPLAEETDLIVPLGRWILGEAVTQARRWADVAPTPPRMSVNVSSRQLRQGQAFVADVAAALQQSGLPSELLVLEVTETVMVEAGEDLVETVACLRALGVELAIDDFGTGFSSLSHLKRFPLANLKLDRSFVADVVDNAADRSIARSVVQLARDLHLRVTAEGIETPEQVAVLRDMGCGDGQGFYLSVPKPAAELHKLIAAPGPPARNGRPRRPKVPA